MRMTAMRAVVGAVIQVLSRGLSIVRVRDRIYVMHHERICRLNRTRNAVKEQRES